MLFVQSSETTVRGKKKLILYNKNEENVSALLQTILQVDKVINLNKLVNLTLFIHTNIVNNMNNSCASIHLRYFILRCIIF